MKKRLFCAVLTAAMLAVPAAGLSEVPLTVMAEDAEGVLTDAATGLQYIIEDGSITITGCDLTAESLRIPAEIGGMPVRRIGKNATYDSKTGGNHVLKTVEIAEGVTAIEESAFYHCSKLTSVTIPSTVTDIGEYAFRGCSSLTSVTIPEGIKLIKNYTFADCGLEELVLPDSVEEIGDYAFESCPFVTLELPAQVSIIGEGAFSHNQMLQYAILTGVVSIGDHAFDGCTNMKAVLFSNALQSIGSEAFSYCQALESVELPDSLLYIGDGAFASYTPITSLTIPDSVLYLGASVCPGAAETVDGVKYLGKWAVGCDGTPESVTVREGTTGIAKGALSTYTLTEVTLPASLTTIDGEAFGASNPKVVGVHVSADNPVYCDVDGVVYSKDQTVLVFYPGGREDAQYTVPDTVQVIGDHAFYNAKNLTEVRLPDGIKIIQANAFQGCKELASVNFPEGLLQIGEGAFCDSEGLFGSDLPDSLVSMGRHAFPLMGGSTYAPMTDGWYDKEYSTSDGETLTIPEGAVGLTDYLFSERTMKHAVLPDSLIYPGAYTFWHSTDLESVKLGSGLIGIEEGDFGKCYALREITIPANVQFIEDGAFIDCTSLERVIIHNPDCEIADSPLTFSETAVIYGLAGSTAQAYAKAYNRTFIALGGVRGDVNADGVFDVHDIVQMQRWLLCDGTTLADWQAGDLCADGELDVFDLGLMKQEILAK